MDERSLYEAAREVADLVHAVAAETGVSMDDSREDKVNPFDNQTSDGLFLEFYYSIPSRLWTPWGKWNFGGGGGGGPDSFAKLAKHVLKKLSATM